MAYMKRVKQALVFVFGMVIVFWLVCPAYADDGDPITLRMKLKKGKAYRFSTVTSMKNSVVRDSGIEDESEIIQEAEHEIKCVKITKTGMFEVEFRYRKYRVTRISYVRGVKQRREMNDEGIKIYEGDELVYDRTWDLVMEQQRSSIPRLVKAVFRITLDQTGRVADYGNVDDIQFEFPDINLKQLVTPGLVLPEGEVRVGAQWSNSSSTRLPVITGSPTSGKTLKNNYEYSLLGIKKIKGRKCAEVETKVIANILDVDPRDVKFNQTTSGRILVDRGTGLVYEADSEMRQELEFKIKGVITSGVNTSKTEIRQIR
jgi:hypothetical protein